MLPTSGKCRCRHITRPKGLCPGSDPATPMLNTNNMGTTRRQSTPTTESTTTIQKAPAYVRTTLTISQTNPDYIQLPANIKCTVNSSKGPCFISLRCKRTCMHLWRCRWGISTRHARRRVPPCYNNKCIVPVRPFAFPTTEELLSTRGHWQMARSIIPV